MPTTKRKQRGDRQAPQQKPIIPLQIAIPAGEVRQKVIIPLQIAIPEREDPAVDGQPNDNQKYCLMISCLPVHWEAYELGVFLSHARIAGIQGFTILRPGCAIVQLLSYFMAEVEKCLELHGLVLPHATGMWPIAVELLPSGFDHQQAVVAPGLVPASYAPAGSSGADATPCMPFEAGDLQQQEPRGRRTLGAFRKAAMSSRLMNCAKQEEEQEDLPTSKTEVVEANIADLQSDLLKSLLAEDADAVKMIYQ
eukprot:TRINITY_DN13531_c0_g1_i1.p1 TRINITY_DN13531_c0_g1~~TRINITY_DN13531_c0_g1_i1.p1  ORF type:complete len:283 (-),score=57.25 TRINITY_DN13531_c0_g1_i1:130-885(-)